MVKVILEVSQGHTVSYLIPALKLQDYSMEDMLKKQLFIMLPFLFFNYEKLLGNTADPNNYRMIEELYGVVIKNLREMTEQNVITAYEADTLFEALKVVVEALGERHNAKKEVQTIMGGNVLEFRADRYYNAGKKEGREEGRAEGRAEGREEGWGKAKEEDMLSGIRRAIKKQKMTLEAAMEYMDIPLEQQPKYAAMLREGTQESGEYVSEST